MPKRPVLQEILRRLDALERRVRTQSRRSQPGATNASQILRRGDILEEESLRREIVGDQALAHRNPTLWQSFESGRLVRNRELLVLNNRLQAEGLPPVELCPSLKQRKQKLKRLEAANRAASARRTGSS